MTQSESQRVLVVDDEPMVREVLTQYLLRDGYVVDEAADGEAALERLQEVTPDLVLLDVMLPKRHGLDVLKGIRAVSSLPVILLTALGEEQDRVAGLELGADDYVVKPFSPREVAARVKSVLRRSAASTPEPEMLCEFGDVVVDPHRREVTRSGEPVQFARLEFDLLAYFLRNPKRVIDRDELLSSVWGSSTEWQDRNSKKTHRTRSTSSPPMGSATGLNHETRMACGTTRRHRRRRLATRLVGSRGGDVTDRR